VREYGPAFNIIHISAAITHLAQLAQRAGTTAGSAHHKQQQQQVVPQLSHAAPSPNEQQVLGLGLITRQMEHTHAHLQAQLHLQLQTPPAAPGISHGNGSSSNGHVPAALLSHADDQVLQQQLVGVLLGKAMSRLHEARSRQVANMLWALAILQQQHLAADSHTTAQAAGVLLVRAAELFSAAEPQHLSNMALAAAKLQLPVTQGWLQQLTDAWLQCGLQGAGRSGAGQSDSQAHSAWVDNIVDSSLGSRGLSSSSLRVHSSTQQVDSSSASVQFGVESVQQGVLTGSGAAEQAAHPAAAAAAAGAAINPQATCNLLWALVQLQQQQQSEQAPWLQEWLQVVVAAAAPQLATWPAKSVSMFLWACARLGYRLHSSTQQTTAAFNTRQQRQRQQQQQQPLTHVVGAGAAPGNDAVLDVDEAVNKQQDPVVVQGLLLALRQQSAAFSSRDLSQALWAAAVLKLPVPGDLLQLLLSASSHQQQLSRLAAARSKQQAQHQQSAVSTAAAGGAGAGSAAASSNGSGASFRQQQQQHGLEASRELAHSVSMVLWSLGRLGGEGAAQQLPRPVLQPWLSGLAASAAAAPGQSLGVAAWAAGQLGLTASCPQLVLHLVQAAAHRQQLTAQQQQQQQMTADISHVTSSVHSSQPGHAAAGSALPAEAVAAVVWCAARCVVQSQLQQQQQQPAQVTSRVQQQQQQQQVIRRQRVPGPFGATDVHAGTSVNTAAAAAAAGRVLGRSQAPPASADKRCQHTAAVQAAASVLLMHWSGTQAGLAAGRTPQLPLWQFSLVLWSASVMQLQLPARWWRDQLQLLQHLLQQSQPHGQLHQQQQDQQQGVHQCREHAQALSAAVWALGRSRVAVPRPHVDQLQEYSLAFLQDPQQRALSEEGSVLLLLGFTRVVTTAAARLPAKTPLQQRQQHKRQRLLRRRLQRQRYPHHTQQRKQSLPRQQALHHEEHLHKHTTMHALPQQQQQHQQHQQAASQLLQRSVVRLEPPPAQQQQQQQQLLQQRGQSHRMQRRRLWWQQYLQQQRVRVAWQRWIWQRQRHGWVSASGLRSEWLRAYCAYSQPLVAAMGRDSVVSVLWALGRLRFHPGSSFVGVALSRAQQLLPVMQARHIALLLWSLARLQVVPEGPVLDQLMHAWEMQLAYASVVDTQQVGWAHKQLQRLQALQGR